MFAMIRSPLLSEASYPFTASRDQVTFVTRKQNNFSVSQFALRHDDAEKFQAASYIVTHLKNTIRYNLNDGEQVVQSLQSVGLEDLLQNVTIPQENAPDRIVPAVQGWRLMDEENPVPAWQERYKIYLHAGVISPGPRNSETALIEESSVEYGSDYTGAKLKHDDKWEKGSWQIPASEGGQLFSIDNVFDDLKIKGLDHAVPMKNHFGNYDVEMRIPRKGKCDYGLTFNTQKISVATARAQEMLEGMFRVNEKMIKTGKKDSFDHVAVVASAFGLTSTRPKTFPEVPVF